jgi:hypothetical protein
MLNVVGIRGPAEPDHFSMIICAVSAIRSVGQYTDCYPRIYRRSSRDTKLLPCHISAGLKPTG